MHIIRSAPRIVQVSHSDEGSSFGVSEAIARIPLPKENVPSTFTPSGQVFAMGCLPKTPKAAKVIITASLIDGRYPNLLAA